MNDGNSFTAVTLSIELNGGWVNFHDNIAGPPVFSLTSEEANRVCSKVTSKDAVDVGVIDFGYRRSIEVKTITAILGRTFQVHVCFVHGTYRGNGTTMSIRTFGKMLAFLQRVNKSKHKLV